jgi:hypothetical protein
MSALTLSRPRSIQPCRQLLPSLAVNRRSLLAPRLSPLDLGRKLKQQVLFAEATDKLYADWQARLRPGEWQADGRLAGHVLHARERNIAQDRRKAPHDVSLVEVERTNFQWRSPKHRRDPGVVVLLPSRDLS